MFFVIFLFFFNLVPAIHRGGATTLLPPPTDHLSSSPEKENQYEKSVSQLKLGGTISPNNFHLYPEQVISLDFEHHQQHSNRSNRLYKKHQGGLEEAIYVKEQKVTKRVQRSRKIRDHEESGKAKSRQYRRKGENSKCVKEITLPQFKIPEYKTRTIQYSSA